MKAHAEISTGSVVKNLPAMQETAMQKMEVQLLGLEDPLEKKMATHDNIFACRISWAEDPGGLQPMESQIVRHYLMTKPLPPKHMLSLHFSSVAQLCLTLCDTMDWEPSCSVQISHSFESDSFWPHELQHTRPPCPSPTPRACSKSC